MLRTNLALLHGLRHQGYSGTVALTAHTRHDAEQLRAAGLSISNNISEGSASPHAAEFGQFLNVARRSLFEDASMLMVFEKLGLVAAAEVDTLLIACDALSRKITNFSRTL